MNGVVHGTLQPLSIAPACFNGVGKTARFHGGSAYQLGAVGDGTGDGTLNTATQIFLAAHAGHGGDITRIPVEVQAAHNSGGMSASVAGSIQQGNAQHGGLKPTVKGRAAAVFVGDDTAQLQTGFLREQFHAAQQVRGTDILLFGGWSAHHRGSYNDGVGVYRVNGCQAQVAELNGEVAGLRTGVCRTAAATAQNGAAQSSPVYRLGSKTRIVCLHGYRFLSIIIKFCYINIERIRLLKKPYRPSPAIRPESRTSMNSVPKILRTITANRTPIP